MHRIVLVIFLLSLNACYYSSSLFDRDSADDAQRYTLDTGYFEDKFHFLPSQAPKLLPSPVFTDTPEVRKQLDRFTRRDPQFIIQGLERRSKYYPVMVQIFRDEGIPRELINVAFIESCFRSAARSPAGAVGLWQFMKGTAKMYGLRVGFFEDQRKDPILSTIAAARLLRDLYLRYEDWYLALAAYNAGPGKVNRAIRRCGSRDFWTLSRKGCLKRETRDFVPRFIAVSLIARNPGRYGLEKP